MKVSCLLMLIMWCVNVYAQQFVKYSGNPVFTPSGIVYEQRGIGSPSVLLIRDTFHMLYASGSLDGRGYISYAYSINGISWQRYNNGIPVFFPDSTGWDSFFLDTPEFIYHDSLQTFVMYYFGDTDGTPENSGIGIATSADLKTWTRYSTGPVLTAGGSGEWDGLFIESPSVAFAWGKYWMVYTGVDSTWTPRIGLAVSTDGFQWTKFPGNPIIIPENSWETAGVATPTILFDGQNLRVWFCSATRFDLLMDGQIDTLFVGEAISSDGATWIRSRTKPVLSSLDSPIDRRGPWAPDVIYHPDSMMYYMWYETADGFGLATARDMSSSVALPIKQLSKDLFLIDNRFLWVAPGNEFHITIYNAWGLIVKQVEVYNEFVDLNFLPSGMYFLCITTDNSSGSCLYVVKLVK